MALLYYISAYFSRFFIKKIVYYTIKEAISTTTSKQEFIMKRFWLIALCLTGAWLCADVKLPSIFSDHAVLQRSKATAIYGKADPGEKVSAVYGSAKGETIAGKDGKFTLTLDLSKDDGTAKELTVSGKNSIVIKDVIVGEVWFCTGQSNMALNIFRTLDASAVIRSSSNNKIRMFSMPLRTNLEPQDDAPGQWLIASPENTGRFTAVGYFFAKKLNQTTGSAVGLVNPSWGGSHIEAWICKEHLAKSTPAVKASADKDLDNFINYNTYRDAYIKKLQAWEKSLNWVDDGKSTAPPANAKWTKSPALTSNFPFQGVIWFRKTIDLKPEDIRPDGRVEVYFRKIMVGTTIYWNGKAVLTVSRARSVENWPIRFYIAAKPGKHTMMMRVSGTEKVFHFPGENRIGKQPNAAGWEFFREKVFPQAAPEKVAARPFFMPTRPYANHIPSQIFNALVNPNIRYTAKGVLWYQGESNATSQKSHLYGEHVKALVSCLRASSGNPELRFYAVQLPDHQAKQSDPNVTGYWPVIRDGQTRALKMFPYTAEVIINDTGEANDIHPINKKPVGNRLAAIALNRDYGRKDIVCDAPQAVRASGKGNVVTVEYTNCHGGLIARKLPENYWLIRSQNKSARLVPNSPGSEVEGFALCGKDGKWFWANAVIKGNCVIVTSEKVPHPVKIRYAYQNNPTCNLFNGAGLPAGQMAMDIQENPGKSDAAKENFSLKIEKIYPPNILPNPELKKAADGTVPGWKFVDFSKRGGFTFSVDNGVVTITNNIKSYAYYTSFNVPVEEGVTYYAGGSMRSATKALIWLETLQYNDKRPPYYPPYSNTRIFALQAEPSTDPVLNKELQLFIDPAYIVDSSTWITGGKEFTVPKGHGVTRYNFMAGCYGGKPGHVSYKNLFLVKAEHRAKITLNGRNFTSAVIFRRPRQELSQHRLDPSAKEQSFEAFLPSRTVTYFIELTDVNGKKYERAL